MVLVVLFLLPVALFYTVQYPKVQQRLVHEATHMLSTKLHTTVSVGSIRFRLFNRLAMQNVYVQDLKGDTLFYAGQVSASLSSFRYSERQIGVGTLELADAKFTLLRDTSGNVNLKFIIDALASEKSDTAVVAPEKKPYALRVNRVNARGVHFNFVDELAPDSTYEGSINYKNLHVSDLALDVRELKLDGDTMTCRLELLQFRERSGLNMRRLGGFVSIAPKFIEIKELQILDDFSDIRASYYRMDFEQYGGFKNYLEKVSMSADFTEAKVDFFTIGFFAHPLAKMHLPLTLSGKVNGPVGNLKGRNLELTYGQGTKATVSFSMKGLPDAQNTFFTFDVKKLSSRAGDLLLADSVVLKGKFARHSELLSHLGKLSGRARFTGFLSSFVADAALATDVGSVITDLSFTPSSDTATLISGTLGTEQLQLGQMLRDSLVGRLSFYGKVSGEFRSFKKMALNADLSVPLLDFKGYTYHGIKMKGRLTGQSFKGLLSCDDKNLDFDFRGDVDFAKQKPTFDFKLQLRHADLVTLRLNTRDSISRLSMNATANFEGIQLDDLVGTVLIDNAEYSSGKGNVQQKAISLNVHQRGNVKMAELKSDLVDGHLQARGSVSALLPTLDSVVRYYIPALSPLVSSKKSAPVKADPNKPIKGKAFAVKKEQEYEFELRTKSVEKFFEIVTPGFMLADSTSVSGRFGADVGRVRLSVSTSAMRFGANKILNLSLRSTAVPDSSLSLKLKVDRFGLGDLSVDKLSANGKLRGGHLSLSADYATAIASGNLNAKVHLFKDRRNDLALDVALYPSKVVLGDTVWNLSPSQIRVEKKRYSISNFKLANEHQMMYVNGVISNSIRDSVDCELRSVYVRPLLRAFGSKADLDGKVSGKARLNGLLSSSPVFFINMQASDIVIAKNEMGNLSLRSFMEDDKDISLYAELEKKGVEKLNLSGVLKPNGQLQTTAKLTGMEIAILNPLLKGVLSDISGTLDDNIEITGPLKDLRINGKLRLSNGALRVDFLNTLYQVQGPVEFDNSTMRMRNHVATDDKNRTAKLSFTLGNLTQPQKLYYQLKVEPRNFHVLNTTERNSDIFYGQAYATGVVQIQGKPGEVDISAAASTEPNTQLSIPLGGAAQAQQSGLIDFVTPADKEMKKKVVEKPVEPTNLNVELDFKVTPEAEVVLVLNQNTGDVIKAAGNGNLKLEVQPKNSIFRVFGDYTMQRGEYAVSIQNLLSIKFKIDNGSVIHFSGDIDAATSDIQASYRPLRVPLSGLFGDTVNSRYKHPVPIDCKVHMTGRLTAPDLKFSIDAPTVDSETRDRMQAQLSSEDNVLTQFLSLVLVGQFLPQGNSSFGETLGGATIGELLTAQMTSLVSQFVDANIAIKYTPATSSNPETQFGASVSKNLFSDRLSLSGNVDYQSQRKQTNPNSSDFTGNMEVSYMMDPQGKLRVKAFSHTDDQYSEMVQGSNRYGVGVVYQEEFDNFAELWKAMFRKKKAQDSPVKEPEKVVPPPDTAPLRDTVSVPDSTGYVSPP